MTSKTLHRKIVQQIDLNFYIEIAALILCFSPFHQISRRVDAIFTFEWRIFDEHEPS